VVVGNIDVPSLVVKSETELDYEDTPSGHRSVSADRNLEPPYIKQEHCLLDHVALPSFFLQEVERYMLSPMTTCDRLEERLHIS
jgi:hypothetical protein